MRHAVVLTFLFAAHCAWAGETELGASDFMPSAKQPVGWRGDGSGVFPGATGIPTDWNDGKNVAWKVKMPGYSCAQPIIVGDKVITLADPDYVIACDIKTGKTVWKTAVSNPADRALSAKAMTKMRGAPVEHVSRTMPTPVTDGQHVYVRVGVGVVAALRVSDGKVVWSVKTRILGRFDVMSPVLVDGVLICNQPRKPHSKTPNTVAYDAATGKVRWEENTRLSGWGTGTPVVVRGKKRTLVVTGGGTVLDPQTGKQFFRAIGSHYTGGSPGIWGNLVAFGSGTKDRELDKKMGRDQMERHEFIAKMAKEKEGGFVEGVRIMRVLPDGEEVDVEVVYHHTDHRGMPSPHGWYESPLAHPNGKIYYARGHFGGAGQVFVFDPSTLKTIQQLKEGPHPQSRKSAWSYCSPTATRDVLIVSRCGPVKKGGSVNLVHTYMINPDGTLSKIATMEMERHVASPTAHGSSLYFRTGHHLWRIGK